MNNTQLITELALSIAKKKGLTDSFLIEATDDLIYPDCIWIEHGNPPIIYISNQFYNQCLINALELQSKGKDGKIAFISFKQWLQKAIEKCPKMTWTLSNTPPSISIVYVEGNSKWVKRNNELEVSDTDEIFDVDFIVMVKDKITHTSISIPIDDVNDSYKAVREAKIRLLKMINADSEKQKEMYEYLKKSDISKIIISNDERGIKEDIKYE